MLIILSQPRSKQSFDDSNAGSKNTLVLLVTEARASICCYAKKRNKTRFGAVGRTTVVFYLSQTTRGQVGTVSGKFFKLLGQVGTVSGQFFKISTVRWILCCQLRV